MSKNLLNALLLVMTVILYMMVIKPLYTGQGGIIQPERSVQELMALNGQYDDALARADSLMSQATTLKDEYSRVSDADKEKMAVMLPDHMDKVRLLSEALKIAADAGFVLSDLSYNDGGNDSSGVSKVNLSFTVKTTYPRFKALMDNFEKSMRLYSISSISFSSPEKEGDLTTYQVRLQTFYLK